MYTWGYIKEAALAKMDLSVNQAVDMGLMNKMPFYANEAITHITSAIKAKRAYVEYECRDRDVVLCELKEKYHLDDVSYLLKQPCDKSTLSSDQLSALDEYNSYVYVGDTIKFPDDFVMWSDDINFRAPYKGFHFGFSEASDEDYQTLTGNSFMFMKTGYYKMAYKAKWFKILPTTLDSFELDCPDDILECLPTYIASQLYKIDDETKSAILYNQYEMMLARIDENDYASNKRMKVGGDW